MQQGKLIVFTAPSGAGKTTLVRHLLHTIDNLMFSVSATTRARRSNEVDGRDYYFISVEDFKLRIARGDFLEWQEVYDGNYYGTLKSEIQRIFDIDKNVIFDVDVEGALNIKKSYGNQVLTVFVKPPSLDVLRQRLLRRHTEDAETLQRRVDKAALELQYEEKFDVVVYNDDINIAKADAEMLISQFLCNKPIIHVKPPRS